MKTRTMRTIPIRLYDIIVRSLSLILSGLLLYTATKKLMDIEAFSAHLELLPYAGETAADILTIGVMLVEYALGFIILYRPQDARGYLMIVSLMLAYTGYIYYILHHAPFLPCSCQGAFKALSWEMHYVINAVVAVVAGLAIWRTLKIKKQRR